MATTHYVHADDQTLKTELDVFIPEIWSDAIRASFHKSLVMGNIATDYSALVAGGGDKIHIPTYKDVADAAAKVQGEPVDFTTNTEVEMSIDVDQHYVTAIMIDNLAKTQASYDLTTGIASSMGYKLALNIEKALFTKLSNGLNAVQMDNGDDSVDRVLNKNRLSHILTYMYSVNLRPEECVMVLSNRLYASLFKLDDFVHVSKIGSVNLPQGTVGTLMGMPVIHSPEVGNDAIHADTTAEDGSALADTRRPGGYVVHKSALGIAYSKRPTPVAEYDMQYIAHKMVTDVIYGCNLLQDTNQVRAISLCENDQDTAAAWQS
tara:strand:- start:257 stop:1216 length:960 start_codon:yes stop_codon:yes gene_type:complete